MKLNQKIKNKLEEELEINISSFSSLSGGCISNAYKIKTIDNKNYLLKINESHKGDMFLKEANGLVELKKANAIKVPEVILAEKDFILLEFINSSGRTNSFFKDFGIRFSEMHKYSSSTFGFYENNYPIHNPYRMVDLMNSCSYIVRLEKHLIFNSRVVPNPA